MLLWHLRCFSVCPLYKLVQPQKSFVTKFSLRSGTAIAAKLHPSHWHERLTVVPRMAPLKKTIVLVGLAGRFFMIHF